MEYYTTQNRLKYHLYAYHAIIIKIRQLVSGIINNIIDVSVLRKFQIQPYVAYDSTDGEIICMYKSVNKTKAIRGYTEALSLHTGSPKVYWEDNTRCISVFEFKIVTPRIKYIDIPVFFLQEQFDNGIFVPKYENYSVILEDMCTKPCSGTILSRSNKWMTGFRFYPNSDT